MEFGPRALGARSIIGDARSPKMQEMMNLKIKFRESFRPFAPSVLRERVSEWFELDEESPYMLLVAPVAKSHCREMTAEENKKFRPGKAADAALDHSRGDARGLFRPGADRDGRHNPALLSHDQTFEEKHGCPVIINTSFNVRGEPIVCIARRCLSLLHAHEHGLSGRGQFSSGKKGPKAARQGHRLAEGIRARLTDAAGRDQRIPYQQHA